MDPAPVQVDAWPCVIAEADFEQNTITLKMQCSDYKVGAGKHWLHATKPAAQPAVPLTDDELDVCRQWFNSIKDTNGGYLTGHDYALAEKLHMHLGLRVPDSVKQAATAAQPATPLTKEQVRDLCKSAGCGMTSMQARADFINGIRHGEAAHGITKGGAA